MKHRNRMKKGMNRISKMTCGALSSILTCIIRLPERGNAEEII